MFFNKKEKVDNSQYPKDYINGFIYKIYDEFYLIKNDKSYQLPTQRIRESWGLPVIELAPTQGLPAPVAGHAGFRDGTLIQNAKDGRIYVISGAKKRLVTVPLGDYGLDISQIVEVSDSELQIHADGEDIE